MWGSSTEVSSFGPWPSIRGRRPCWRACSGSSQVLADALRRRPNILAWLLEPRTMRVWLAEDYAVDLAQTLAAFTTRESRLNALRRFKYRQLLRIGARDLLADADVAQTTEELSHLADACLGEAWRMADAAAQAEHGAPRDGEGERPDSP